MSVIRKVLPHESGQIYDHLLRLHADDMRLRFGGVMLKPIAVARYVESIDWPRSVAIGCWENERLRGVAQLALPNPARPWSAAATDAAELALSVERDLQNIGIGTQLLTRALLSARNHMVKRVFMFCIPENARMRRVAVKCGLRVAFANGEVWASTELSPPDQFTVMAEAWTDQLALVDEMIERIAG
ncbi:MAG: GNAT family N-acetyltransferase [Alphaproteobacteria bacterium]